MVKPASLAGGDTDLCLCEITELHVLLMCMHFGLFICDFTYHLCVRDRGGCTCLSLDVWMDFSSVVAKFGLTLLALARLGFSILVIIKGNLCKISSGFVF